MKKVTALAMFLTGFCSVSYGQLYKINASQPYDNLNHDRQRDKQLSPNYSYVLPRSEKSYYIPPVTPLAKSSRNSSVHMLNNTKINAYPVHDYVGKGTSKAK